MNTEQNTKTKTMKVMKEIVEMPNEGLVSLLGENVLIFAMNYFYFGKLVGVNDQCVKIEKCHKVFETGPFTEKAFKNKQFIGEEWYVSISSIESFGKSPKL